MLHNSTRQLKKNTNAVVKRLQGIRQYAKRGVRRNRSRLITVINVELTWSTTASPRALVVGY